MKKYFILPAAVLMGALTFTSCESDDDNKSTETETSFDIVTTTPILDQETYPANTDAASYNNKTFGQEAISGCTGLVNQLEAANAAIASAKLTTEQEAYLREVLKTLVSNVIVPTYTKLADNTEDLESTLNGLTVGSITQAQINKACEDFKEARKYWE